MSESKEKMKNISDGRMGLEDGEVATKLIDKSYSPLIVRKYTRLGFPLYIALICDANLEDLDTVVRYSLSVKRRELSNLSLRIVLAVLCSSLFSR